jgi:hypothetical protein
MAQAVRGEALRRLRRGSAVLPVEQRLRWHDDAAMTDAAALRAALAAAVPATALAWLDTVRAGVAAGEDRTLFLAVGQAGRQVGRQALDLPPWSADQAARALLALAIPSGDPVRWLATLDRLFHAGTVEELVALYQALPLFQHPAMLAARAAEGVRSNMRPVFAAVAFANPYPAAHLDDQAFNQLVLKCFFVGEDPGRIVGLDRRRNPDLGRMLADYARERRAARRTLDPRLPPLARACGADCPDQP